MEPLAALTLRTKSSQRKAWGQDRDPWGWIFLTRTLSYSSPPIYTRKHHPPQDLQTPEGPCFLLSPYLRKTQLPQARALLCPGYVA